MHETDQELEALQRLLDASYGAAGSHLGEIHTGEARLGAREVVGELAGMQVFVVATISRDGRPFTGPVDAFLYRGRVVFGTAPTALRARHLARSPAVSATHVRGEALVVTVHGRARSLEPSAEPAFLDVLRGQYGAATAAELGANPYFLIEPDRMFAADMRVHQASS